MPGGNSIWFHKGFLLAWNSCVLMWVTHAVFILDALEITMKGNYILLLVMFHGATPHRGLRGSHAATLHRGAGVHTQHSHHAVVFFFLNTNCCSTRGTLRVSHLACCLCKQMADKQKIMDGWMEGRIIYFSISINAGM